jgi:heparanase 1
MAALVAWTAAQPPAAFPVAGYELGNEPDLFCRRNATLLPARLAADVAALRRTLDAAAAAHGRRRYALLGPDTAAIGTPITKQQTGNPEAVYRHYFAQFAGNLSARPAAAAPVVDELTFHQYYFKGPTADPDGGQFVNVTVLDSLRPKILLAVAAATPRTSRSGRASLGETSSAYGGGTPALSDSFASTFGWVDKLGLAARLGLARVVRQQLCCGGNPYDLLQQRGHAPTPDYWATLLWKRLMGGRVLGVAGDDRPGRALRAYAHCAAGGGGGVALAVVNVARAAASLDLRVGAGGRREVYRLGTVEGVFTGRRATLNGRELRLTGARLPPLPPAMEAAGGPLAMPALSVAFVVLPDAYAPACT